MDAARPHAAARSTSFSSQLSYNSHSACTGGSRNALRKQELVGSKEMTALPTAAALARSIGKETRSSRGDLGTANLKDTGVICSITQVSGWSADSIKSDAKTVTTNQKSYGNAAVKLPIKGGGAGDALHTEEDLLKGLTLQAVWSENLEFTSLMSAALRICRLSITASDGEWNDAYSTFLQLLAMSKARLARQQALFCAKYNDLEVMLSKERETNGYIKEYDTGILEAQTKLLKAKRNRQNREKYEALALEVSKKSSLSELHVAQIEEMRKMCRTEKKTKMLEEQIAAKQRQAQVIVKAASDMLQLPAGGVSAEKN